MPVSKNSHPVGTVLEVPLLREGVKILSVGAAEGGQADRTGGLRRLDERHQTERQCYDQHYIECSEFRCFHGFLPYGVNFSRETLTIRTVRLAGCRGGGGQVSSAGWRDPQRPGSRRFLGFTSRQMNAKGLGPYDWGRGLIEHCKQPFDSEGSGIRSWGEQEADVAQTGQCSLVGLGL